MRAASAMNTYLISNEIDLCCPCVHDGKLYGLVLLGAKRKGIYSGEEVAALQLMASHVASAVRKCELLQLTRELYALDQMKGDLISNITHEFKSPLAIIESAIEVLMGDARKGRLDANKVTDYLVMMKNGVGNLETFIQGLLDVAKIEQAKLE